MENLINIIKEIFTKPMIYWSATEYIIITTFIIACLFIIFVILGAICGLINYLKNKKNRRKRKLK